MEPKLYAENISYAEFQERLRSYEDHVPEKIQGLEELRLRQVPEVLSQRREDGNAFLEKTEVTGLVEWKLKHGTYRPNLAKLVAANSIEDIKKTTKDAFATYEADNNDASQAVTTLSRLKGVGPATASLFLSCYDPVKVPFFSDELFRYLNWSDAKSKGWDRKINYTIKEYKNMYDKTRSLRERLEKESGQTVRAIDLEKMAYVLAKGAQQGPTGWVASKQEKRDHHDGEESDKALRPPSIKRRK